MLFWGVDGRRWVFGFSETLAASLQRQVNRHLKSDEDGIMHRPAPSTQPRHRPSDIWLRYHRHRSTAPPALKTIYQVDGRWWCTTFKPQSTRPAVFGVSTRSRAFWRFYQMEQISVGRHPDQLYNGCDRNLSPTNPSGPGADIGISSWHHGCISGTLKKGVSRPRRNRITS